MRIRSIIFLCALAGVAVFAGPAQADPILGCGSTVTESIVLDHDIGPCPDGGLAVEGGNVSIDLNGHAITGSGAGTGILIRTSPDGTPTNISVRQGTITGFSMGVGILVQIPEGGCGEPATIAVDKVEIHSNETGISTFGFQGCPASITLSRNNVSGNTGDGISSAIAGPVSIVENHVTRNGRTGIRALFDSVRRIDGNFVFRNGEDGIHVEDSVASITVPRLIAHETPRPGRPVRRLMSVTAR